MHAGLEVDRHTDARNDIFITGRVDARAANQLVGPGAPDEHVVARAAGNDVVPGIATPGEVTGTGKGQALDFAAHPHAGLVGTNLVVAASSQFTNSHGIFAIEDIHIVTGAAVERHAAGVHGKHIGIGRAGDDLDVAEQVALGVPSQTASGGAIDGNVHGLLGRGVAQSVITTGTVESIGLGITDEVIAVHRAPEGFDPDERIALGQTGVDASLQVDGDAHPRIVILITGRIDAGTANQLVGTRAADQYVIAIATIDDVVTGKPAYLIVSCSTHQSICTIRTINYSHYIFLVWVGNYGETLCESFLNSLLPNDVLAQ